MNSKAVNVRDAILLAADHIERNPGLYDFSLGSVPECGTPGCLFGWIGHFLGMKGAINSEVAQAMGIEDKNTGRLYEFCFEINPTFTGSATVAADTLRAYADAHHPAERAMPDWAGMARNWVVGDMAVSEELFERVRA